MLTHFTGLVGVLEADSTGFCCDCVEFGVVRAVGDVFQLLGGECAAEAVGVGQGGEGAVVVAGAVAKAVAETVIGEQGREDEIRDCRDLRFWVQGFEAACFEDVARCPAAENQGFAACWGDGEAELVAAVCQAGEKGQNIDLAVERPEASDD